MPTYDYECKTCHHAFELRQSFDSKPVATCPNCQNGAQRQFRAVPVVFKGSGFYVNDYAKQGAKSDSTSASKDSTSKKDKKSETADSSSNSKEKPKAEAKAASGPAKSTDD